MTDNTPSISQPLALVPPPTEAKRTKSELAELKEKLQAKARNQKHQEKIEMPQPENEAGEDTPKGKRKPSPPEPPVTLPEGVGDYPLLAKHIAGQNKIDSKAELFKVFQNLPARLAYNELAQCIYYADKPASIENLFTYLSGKAVRKETVCAIATEVARANSYHPVREMLLSLQVLRDEVTGEAIDPYSILPHGIERLASTYLRPEDLALPEPTLYDRMLKVCLIGAVMRAIEPHPTKHDTACIIAGKQGIRKSTFWKVLFGVFYHDGLSDITSKDDLLKLHNYWGIEWAEMDYLNSKRAAGQVKAFLSTETDQIRRPYGREAEKLPRRFVLVGTTNKQDGFLHDETGNRRFHIIPSTCTLAKPIDTERLAKEREAILHLAVKAYLNGELNYLGYEDSIALEDNNEAYQQADPWLEPLRVWYAPKLGGQVFTEQALDHLNIEIGKRTKGDETRVGKCLLKLGLTKKRVSINGKQRWCYYRDYTNT